MIVIASIHQPSTSTFELFDSVALLSKGQTVYCGDRESMLPYLSSVGYPAPLHMNPSEFVLDLVNTDFRKDEEDVDSRATDLRILHDHWANSKEAVAIQQQSPPEIEKHTGSLDESLDAENNQLAKNLARIPAQTGILMQRSLVKAYRDVLTYYVRLAMYFGMSLLV